MAILQRRHAPSALTSIAYARRRYGWSLASIVAMWFKASRSPYVGRTNIYGTVCTTADEFFRAMSARRYGGSNG